jgi:4-amino-4-deoxy-L-arabinose transferase-like glycosyltransferase
MRGDYTKGRPGRGFALLLFAFGCAYLALLGIRPLFNPDEGRYVDIPAEMLASHDWVLPHLNGLAYLEKPPLQYWLSAGALALFGHTEWAGRLVSALAAILGVWTVIGLGRRLYDERRALFAGVITGSMLLFVLMGQLTTLDMLLSTWLLVAIAGFCHAQCERDADPVASRRWMLVCWAAMGAATLTKGLVGLVLPGGVLVLYTLLQRDWSAWRHLHLGKGLLLCALIVVPWFVLVERAHPGAFDFLIIREHFQRYLTKMHDRYEPWWFFLEILAAGALPWLPQILVAYLHGWRTSAAPGRFDAGRVLWVASVFIVAFYSASDSKLAPYVLPVLPLLALLGSATDARGEQCLRWNGGLLVVLGLACWVAAALAGHEETRAMQAWREAHLVPWFVGVGALFVSGGLAVVGASVTARFDAARLIVAATGFTAVMALSAGAFTSVATLYSSKPLLQRAGPLDPNAPIYTVRDYDWTLPFYVNHPVIPVVYTGELEMGLHAEPAKGLATVEQFEQVWRNHPGVDPGPLYALVRLEDYDRLVADGLEMQELARDFDHVLVRSRER